MTHFSTRSFKPLTLDRPARYRIEIQGQLNDTWSINFGGLTISVRTNPGGGKITTLQGLVADQASLHGILNSIRDLGLPLLSVEYLPMKAAKDGGDKDE
jgi:hypothetical protein